jgi:hypothetical protein
MLKLIAAAVVALLVTGAPALSPKEAVALATARSTVAEMAKLAITPDEKKLAEQDRILVERAIRMTEQRAAARAALLTAQGGGQSQLLAATKAMQETQMSFNLQYLQLQSQMQHENRSYTAISNIMKTKHDTVKNSISNVR